MLIGDRLKARKKRKGAEVGGNGHSEGQIMPNTSQFRSSQSQGGQIPGKGLVVEAGREKSYWGAEGVPHRDGLRDSANCLSSTAHYWTKNWL